MGFVGSLGSLHLNCIKGNKGKKNETYATKSETGIFNFRIWDAIQAFWGAFLFRKLAFVLNQNE